MPIRSSQSLMVLKKPVPQILGENIPIKLGSTQCLFPNSSWMLLTSRPTASISWIKWRDGTAIEHRVLHQTSTGRSLIAGEIHVLGLKESLILNRSILGWGANSKWIVRWPSVLTHNSRENLWKWNNHSGYLTWFFYALIFQDILKLRRFCCLAQKNRPWPHISSGSSGSTAKSACRCVVPRKISKVAGIWNSTSQKIPGQAQFSSEAETVSLMIQGTSKLIPRWDLGEGLQTSGCQAQTSPKLTHNQFRSVADCGFMAASTQEVQAGTTCL